MHALIVDGAVAKYPYTIGMLRKDNPNTSFPKRPSDELLAQWGMQPVSRTERPDVDHTKNVTEGTPVLQNGYWRQVWSVADASAAEIAGHRPRLSAPKPIALSLTRCSSSGSAEVQLNKNGWMRWPPSRRATLILSDLGGRSNERCYWWHDRRLA